jgi:hypothetical protein
MPERLRYLWDMFLDIQTGRTYGMDGPQPLSWREIKAWDDLTETGLQEWEVRVIRMLDATWLRVVQEARNG